MPGQKLTTSVVRSTTGLDAGFVGVAVFYYFFVMKIHNLLVALTVGAFTAATMLPWMVVAQGATEFIDDSGVLTLAGAQRAAAKITVRVRVGQGGGSGVLLAKTGGTYLVLTNAHVVQGQGGVTVVTPDGQVQVARRVQDAQVGDFDLALLEFNSARSYDLAGFANFEKRDAVLREGRELLAAGFPYDANGLKLLSGKVTQLPQEAFKNGTQVGYVTEGDLIQGMSGGPILDSIGNLVGINSTLARPVIDSYVYADGSKAPSDKVAEYRQANWGVPMYNLLTRLNPDVLYSYQQLPKLHRAVTPTGHMAELDRKARAVTVRIEKSNGGNGSGVIVARDGNSYYVLTNEHVVTKDVIGNGETKKIVVNVKVTTTDQRSYAVAVGDINLSDGTDLAVVKFTSNESYRSATLGNYNIADDSIIFTAGWPDPKYINSQQWQWQINPGIISGKERGEFQTQDKVSFSNGYDLIYSSITYGGMSGGPVFDHAGKVIGIHGKAEGNGNSRNILGNSLGVSIKTFIGLADRLNVPKRLQVETMAPDTITEKQFESIDLARNNITTPTNNSGVNRWIEYGNQLYRLQKHADAVKAFDRAILLQANSLDAYYGKALSLFLQDNSLAALTSLDQAIASVPLSDQFSYYYLWKYRSVFLQDLKRYPEALVAISQAISLEPQDIILLNQKASLLRKLKRYSEAAKIYDEVIIIRKQEKAFYYSNRGVVKLDLGDTKAAMSDFDKAISINPQFDKAYSNRAIAKYDLGDKQGAVLDYDKAININPQYVLAYSNRGNAKSYLGDKQGAILDYDKAININPQSAEAYSNRGAVKLDLGDIKGAVSDLDRAISINPQFAEAYSNRGNAKHKLGDKQGSISDSDQAININPQSAGFYLNRSGIKLDLGDIQGAISDSEKAINIDPRFFLAYFNRGLAKYRLGNRQEAISDFDKVISISSQFFPAYFNRGKAKYKLGDGQGAISDFNRAISINPEDPEIYYNRSIVKSELGNKQGAISDLNTAIRINPQFFKAYFNRGIIRSELRDKQGAISDFNTAIRINPQFGQAYFLRGYIKYDLGDKKGTIEDLKIAAQLFKSQNNQELYNKTIDLLQLF